MTGVVGLAEIKRKKVWLLFWRQLEPFHDLIDASYEWCCVIVNFVVVRIDACNSNP